MVYISIYSHRPEAHDGITRVPGSFERSVNAIRYFKRHGVKVEISAIIMRGCETDYPGIRDLAAQLGVEAKIDITVTPHLTGGTAPVENFHVPLETLRSLLHDPSIVGDVEKFCAPPAPADDNLLDSFPCSAGHSLCYISPQGNVTPCVQFPLVCGNLRKGIRWKSGGTPPSSQRVRGITLPTSRFAASARPSPPATADWPGLAYQEGDMAGPSSSCCDKTYARTGIPSPLTGIVSGNREARSNQRRTSSLVPLSALLPAPPVEPYRDAAAC